MKALTLSLFGLSSAMIFGCSSAPQLPNTWTLKTTPKSQNYFYCESCPQPTKLTNQVYQPLEPDEPVIITEPIASAEPLKITNNQRKPLTKSQRSHKKHHKSKHSRKPVQPKQCIQWSP